MCSTRSATASSRCSSFVNAGSKFIFGSLMDTSKFGFIFAFQVLPTIIFFAALMGVLYHLGVMQAIVRGMAWAITKVMRVSGAETTVGVRQRLHRPDRSAADRAPVHPAHDRVGTDHDDDRRHGAHRRRRARRVRRHARRRRSGAAGVLRQAPAGRVDHGGAGDAGRREDPDSRNRRRRSRAAR